MAKLSNEELFMKHVLPEPMSGCWLWSAADDSHGYGYAFSRAYWKQIKAHRLSYELFVGPVPEGKELDHKCRVRCCVNPQHLEPVTHLENVRRGEGGKAGAAFQRSKTHCRSGHPYDESNTYRHVDKHGQEKRHCRECMRQSCRRWSPKRCRIKQ